MNEYLCNSLAWSLVDYFAGVLTGLAIRHLLGRQPLMTIRNKLTDRNVIFGLALLLLAGYTIWSGQQFRAEDKAQRDCLSSYIAANSATSKVRSQLVARESDATRQVIRSALTAKSLPQLIAAREHYFKELRIIDNLRAENPLVKFNEARCG